MKFLSTLRAAKLQAKQVGALAAPYFWKSSSRWHANGLLLAIVVLNLAAVGMLVVLNKWNVGFYNALQNKDAQVFWQQLGRFLYLAFGYIAIMVYKFYLSQLLELGWRKWMTEHTLQRWLSHTAFYKLELPRLLAPEAAQGNLDNPDQRIQEDLAKFANQSISLSMGLLHALVTLASFVGILWGLSGVSSFQFQDNVYSIYGSMVWMALVYCLLGSWVTQKIGHSLSRLSFLQERLEANFRHRLVMVREYSAAIALEQGQTSEGLSLRERFAKVVTNSFSLIKTQKHLLWFTTGFGQLAMVFPFMVAAPRFFSGAIALGGLMQIASAFGRVQESLAWFIDNYTNVAAWHATTKRLIGFQTRLEQAIALKAEKPSPPMAPVTLSTPLWRLRVVDLPLPPTALSLETSSIPPPATAEAEKSLSSCLQVQNLHVYRPDGQCLLRLEALVLKPGNKVLLQGPSGSGKSTFLRTLAGLWPYQEGKVNLPPNTVFVPQRPYLPTGTLRAALAYPKAAGEYSTEVLLNALSQAELDTNKGNWHKQLDEESNWGQQLSIGEQQRLSLARVFLQNPLFLFLDEATSALDASTEEVIYTRLLTILNHQQGSLVSVAHRQSLVQFHSQLWQLEKNTVFSWP